MSFRFALLFFGLCLLGSCTSFHTKDGYLWVGHWEDGTGYFLDISYSNGRYILGRSGNPSRLTFLDLSSDERRFRYREEDDFIHTLTVVSRDKIHDQWLELRNNEIWPTMSLCRRSTTPRFFNPQSASDNSEMDPTLR